MDTLTTAQFGMPQTVETGITKDGREYKITEHVTREGRHFFRFVALSVSMTGLVRRHRYEYWTLKGAQEMIDLF